MGAFEPVFEPRVLDTMLLQMSSNVRPGVSGTANCRRSHIERGTLAPKQVDEGGERKSRPPKKVLKGMVRQSAPGLLRFETKSPLAPFFWDRRPSHTGRKSVLQVLALTFYVLRTGAGGQALPPRPNSNKIHKTPRLRPAGARPAARHRQHHHDSVSDRWWLGGAADSCT